MKDDIKKPTNIPANFENGIAVKPLSSLAAGPGGLRQALQRDNFYTVLYSESAKGSLTVDFNRHTIENQTVYFISPEQLHKIEIQESSTGMALFFTQDFLERHGIATDFLTDLELFFNCDEVPPLHLPPETAPRLERILEMTSNEVAAREPLYLESLGAYLKLFLIACRRVKASQAVENELLTKPQAEIVRRFKRLVETMFKTERRVSTYAKKLNLTPNYLNEVIKRETGVSAKAFILNRVMLEAKRLAVYSDLQQKQISRQLGFSDVAHFGKLFKTCAGKSFSEFREQRK